MVTGGISGSAVRDDGASEREAGERGPPDHGRATRLLEIQPIAASLR